VSIADYSALKSAVADWLNREDLTVTIPTFISLAEARFNRDLRVRQMIKRATTETDSGENYVTLPSDWLEARNIQIYEGSIPVALEYLTLEQADDYKRRRGSVSGAARYFNVTGDQLELIPEPPIGTPIEMAYYAKIPPLAECQSNWLLTTWPDMYLYGTLAHSAPYLKDDERIDTWAALYDRGLAEINLADEKAQYSGSVLKMRTRSIG
jgi:hypothetical protein